MVETIVQRAKDESKNILILGAPRSGTHALGSIISQLDPALDYVYEIGMNQKSDSPWDDFEIFHNNNPRTLAHVVQSYAKLFAVGQADAIKEQTIIISLRRRDKVKQFASWKYFQKIGAIYNFDHFSMDYVSPGSLTATLFDIEYFILDQIIDTSFAPDYVLYYEELPLSQSKIRKNHYSYPIENIFSNLDFVKKHLENWKYNE